MSDRTRELEAHLNRLRPIWHIYHRELFRGRDGSYIIRGHDGSGKNKFYLHISRSGTCGNLLGGKIGPNEFYTIVSCFQKAGIPGMSEAISRWYSNQR